MSAGRVTDLRILLAAGVLTVFIAAAGALVTPAEGPTASAPSSFSTSPRGGKAAYLTLRDLGYRVERSYEPLTALRVPPETSTLLITGPGDPSEQDVRAMQAFLDAGGIALVVGAPGARFLGTGSLKPDPAVPSAGRHRVVAPSAVVAGVSEITIASGPELEFPPSFVSLFVQSDRRPLVTTASVGMGRAVWLAAPTPLTNEHIGSADNLQFLLNVVGPSGGRAVIWDEHYHGYTRSFWSYAAATPLPWVGAQVLLLGLAALAVFSRRSGPIRPRAVDPRTSPLEFIDMLQALYRRSDAAPAAIAAALARYRRTVAVVSGVPVAASDDAAAAAAAAKGAGDPREIRELIAVSRRASGDQKVDADVAVTLAAKLQELTMRLRQGR